MNNIELSFCIPTYNRAQIVYRLVTDILLCSDPAIEVVVLDNGSTDGTLRILSSIKDSRLCVYSNGENKGALFNMVNVLSKGRGKYLVFSTDQDHIDNTKIEGFKTFIMQQANLAGGFCAFNSEREIDFEIIPQGYPAIKKIAYQGRHPTGYFFNNEFLKSIFLVERFSDYDIVDLFPLEFAFAEICLMGVGAIYYKSIFTPETGTMVVKHKSATTDGKSKKAFFAPEARLKLAVNYTVHICTLSLAPHDRKALIVDTFIREIVAATIGYKMIVKNSDLCIHYNMEARHIKIFELLSIGFNFYNQYRHKTILVWGKGFLSQMSFEIHIFLRVLMKMKQSLAQRMKVVLWVKSLA